MRTHNARNASRGTAASSGVLLAAGRRARGRPPPRVCRVKHCVRCENIARSPPRGVFGRFRIARNASRAMASHRMPLAPRSQRTEHPSRRDHRTECLWRHALIARGASRATIASHEALLEPLWHRTECSSRHAHRTECASRPAHDKGAGHLRADTTRRINAWAYRGSHSPSVIFAPSP